MYLGAAFSLPCAAELFVSILHSVADPERVAVGVPPLPFSVQKTTICVI